MNKGFTLAELLITIGVIGVITAIMAATLNGLRPDQNKIRYLRNYDAVSTAIANLARNTKMFPICQDDMNCRKHPLFNTSGVNSRGFALNEGDGKLCQGLSYALNGVLTPNLNCDNQPLEYADGDWTPSFNTSNGIEWFVSTVRVAPETGGEGIGTYQTDIYFDINGSAEPNCVYSEECTKPDRFKLLVAADGTIISADPVGQHFLKTRKNLLRKDFTPDEENNLVLASLADDIRSFPITSCENKPKQSEEEEEGGGGIDEPHESEYIECGDKYRGYTVNCYNYYNNCEFGQIWGDAYAPTSISFDNAPYCYMGIKLQYPVSQPVSYLIDRDSLRLDVKPVFEFKAAPLLISTAKNGSAIKYDSMNVTTKQSLYCETDDPDETSFQIAYKLDGINKIYPISSTKGVMFSIFTGKGNLYNVNKVIDNMIIVKPDAGYFGMLKYDKKLEQKGKQVYIVPNKDATFVEAEGSYVKKTTLERILN